MLTTAESLVELRQPLLALFERLPADEGLGLELGLALLELRLAGVEVGGAALELLLQRVEPRVAPLEPLGRDQRFRALVILGHRLRHARVGGRYRRERKDIDVRHRGPARSLGFDDAAFVIHGRFIGR